MYWRPGNWTYHEEYGCAQSMTATYEGSVAKVLCDAFNPASALALAQTDIYMPWYGMPPSPGIPLYCQRREFAVVDQTDTDYIIHAQLEFVSQHLLANTYQFTGRSSLQSVDSYYNGEGVKVQIAYTPTSAQELYEPDVAQPAQAGKLQKLVPCAEFVATGISQMIDPADFVKLWTGKVNSAPVWGWDAYQLLCTEVRFEPVSIALGMWRFQFCFAAAPFLAGPEQGLGWATIAYWKVPDTDMPPVDADPTVPNGALYVMPYRIMDFAIMPPCGSGTIADSAYQDALHQLAPDPSWNL